MACPLVPPSGQTSHHTKLYLKKNIIFYFYFFKIFTLLDILFWCDNTCPYECVSGQQVSSLQPSQLRLSLSTTEYSGTCVSGLQVCWTAAMLLLTEQGCHFSGQLAVWVPVRKSSLDFSSGQAVCLSLDHCLSF